MLNTKVCTYYQVLQDEHNLCDLNTKNSGLSALQSLIELDINAWSDETDQDLYKSDTSKSVFPTYLWDYIKLIKPFRTFCTK